MLNRRCVLFGENEKAYPPHSLPLKWRGIRLYYRAGIVDEKLDNESDLKTSP
jgi:hypothetical protein